MFQKIAGIEIFNDKKWAGGTLFCWLFFVCHSAKTSPRGTRLSSKNFLVSRTIEERGRAGITIFRQKFLVSKDQTWSRKELKTNEVAGNTIFRRHCFCLTVPQDFVEQRFCVSETFWYRKTSELWGRGAYHNFPSKLLCLTEPKQFLKEFFCVSLFFCYRKKITIKEVAGMTVFRRNWFVSWYRIIT